MERPFFHDLTAHGRDDGVSFVFGRFDLTSCRSCFGDPSADKASSRQFRTLWSASQIIERLEALHPDFFPVPFIPQVTGQTSSHLAAGPPDALTKSELLALYGKCGSVLHRGTRAKLLSPNIPEQTRFPDIVRWLNKLHALLDNHIVLMLGGQRVFICEMGAGKDGTVLTRIGEAEGPSKRVP